MYVPEMKSSGNKTSCTTAGAASELRISEATATPRAQKLAAPSTSVSASAGHGVGQRHPEETADADDQRDIHGADHDAVR